MVGLVGKCVGEDGEDDEEDDLIFLCPDDFDECMVDLEGGGVGVVVGNDDVRRDDRDSVTMPDSGVAEEEKEEEEEGEVESNPKNVATSRNMIKQNTKAKTAKFEVDNNVFFSLALFC